MGLVSHRRKSQKVTVAAGERGHRGAQVSCAGKQVRHFHCTYVSYTGIGRIGITRKTIDKDSR